MIDKIAIHLNENQMQRFKCITDHKVGMFVDMLGHWYELVSIFL